MTNNETTPALVGISGNTFPVKDKLKALGARWNPLTRCWDVPADRADEARAIVGGGSNKPAPAAAPAADVNWSDEQKAIFAWFAGSANGNLVVQARAGTGKTTTIKQAFSYAPESGRLLYAVFNKKTNARRRRKSLTPAWTFARCTPWVSGSSKRLAQRQAGR
jgi:hypothetical protein